jgi:hypothetical protein
MAGRGAPTFQKRQKEQQRKEKQQQKMARRAERKTGEGESEIDAPLEVLTAPQFDGPEFLGLQPDPLPIQKPERS